MNSITVKSPADASECFIKHEADTNRQHRREKRRREKRDVLKIGMKCH